MISYVPISVVSRQVLLPSPGPGIGVIGGSFYASRDENRLMLISNTTSRSDTADAATIRLSDDNGRTWSAPTSWSTRFKHPDGTGRRHPRVGYLDEATDRVVFIWTEGVLPTDNPLEGMRHWTLRYFMSEDGGRTRKIEEQIMHAGDGYDAVHPLPGVTVGKNCVMLGDLGQVPIARPDGVLLLPVQSSPTGPDGEYANPGRGYTYTDCLVLMGRWRADEGLSWTCSERVVGDPSRTTRGLIEPTLGVLGDGSILMVMRGSNAPEHSMPGYRWTAISRDGGETWSAPAPWTYDDGEAFYSPSSTSQLIAHSSGHLFWMGNICKSNPRGNSPRYPLVLGEVDRESGRLIRDSVTVVDDRRPGESEALTLSNFHVREDRESGHLLLHMPRFFAQGLRSPRGGPDFTADLTLTTIDVRP